MQLSYQYPTPDKMEKFAPITVQSYSSPLNRHNVLLIPGRSPWGGDTSKTALHLIVFVSGMYVSLSTVTVKRPIATLIVGDVLLKFGWKDIWCLFSQVISWNIFFAWPRIGYIGEMIYKQNDILIL